MEYLYNPDVMSESELKATFVGRESLLEELLQSLRNQPDGAGVQHVAIIAPRGTGKTSVLQRFRYQVLESDLSKVWLPLKFPEELYGVVDLADLWLETLQLLALETQTPELAEKATTLLNRFNERADAADAAFALLKDFRKNSGKRLLMLIENLDMLFKTISSTNEHDNARLREILMNDGTIMLMGSAVEFFKQARDYDQPLYNFFRIINLNAFSFDESQALLLRRAEEDNVAGFAENLQTNSARLHALHHFTQGSPRLVLMLYRVLTQSDVGGVHKALEKLLDEITPYYKARVESLTPQPRKVLEYVARAAAKTNEGISPTALAKTVGLPVNQVSEQLKRLVNKGFLRSVPLRGRSACYVLSEPLYALWHQMRLNPETRTRKLSWLVGFLHEWYDDRERIEEAKRLYQIYKESEKSGDGVRAFAIIEHLAVLADSALATPVAGEVQRLAARSYVRFKDKKFGSYQTSEISNEMLIKQLDDINASLESNPEDIGSWVAKSILLNSKSEHIRAMECIDRALKINDEDADAWFWRGYISYDLERYKESLAAYNNALEIDPNNAVTWNNRGVTLESLGKYSEASESYNHVLKLGEDDWAKNNRARLIASIEDNFRESVYQNKFTDAKTIWNDLSGNIISGEEKHILKRCILFAAEMKHLAFARRMISDAGLHEELFPLDRALEYLLSNDETLIEKLTPEIKEAVRLVANDLRPMLEQKIESNDHLLARAKLSIDDDYIGKRGHLVHKLRAKDSRGSWAFYFVLVLEANEKDFLNALKSDETIDLGDYGRVVASNYGEEANDDVKSMLKQKYGFEV